MRRCGWDLNIPIPVYQQAHVLRCTAVAVTAAIAVTAVLQVEALREFMEMLGCDPARAFYGPGHVFAANDLGGCCLCCTVNCHSNHPVEVPVLC